MDAGLHDLLRDINDPSKFVKIEDVPIFDEHEEEVNVPERDKNGNFVRDAKGHVKYQKVTRRYTVKELREIAKRNNHRNQTGNFAPLTVGHTRPDEPEPQQPEHIGIQKDYRVRYDANLRRNVLTTDFYIPKASYEKAASYPRVSVELFPDDLTIDPIALIRRTPRRDLGYWTTHDGRRREVEQYSRLDRRTGRYREVTRYSIGEWNVPDNMPPVEPGNESPEKMAMDYARHCTSHPFHSKLAEHFAAEEPMNEEPAVPPTEPPAAEPEAEEPATYAAPPAFAAPGATNAGTGKKPDEYARRQRDQQSLQFSRYEERLKALEAKAAAKDAEILQYQRQAEAEKYERRMVQLEAEGSDINRADEMEFVMSLPTPEHREKYMARLEARPKAPVQQYGRITPATTTPVSGKVDPVNNPESVPADDYAAVDRYQKQCGDYGSPLHVQLARALPHKYGHLTNGNGKGA